MKHLRRAIRRHIWSWRATFARSSRTLAVLLVEVVDQEREWQRQDEQP